jgi:hypothetical protein
MTEQSRKGKGRTEASRSTMLNTQARLSAVKVRIVSVRPCANIRVKAVSYVAVNSPRVLYQASWKAIWI